MSYLNYIGRFVNALFFPLYNLHPVLSVIILTLFLTSITIIFRKKFLGK